MSEISAKRVVTTSFVVDIIDIITNITVALLTGSMVMIVESLQGLADLSTVGLLLLGVKRSSRSPDARHPFGYGRELYFWTLISSVIMLVFTATTSFFLGLNRFLRPEPIDNVFLAIFVLIIAVITNGYALSLDIKRLSKNLPKSRIVSHFFASAHIETKTVFVLDLIGVASALSGLLNLSLYKLTQNLHFDGLGAMMIGVVLGILSLALVVEAKELLIGKAASRQIHQLIRQIVLGFDQVVKISSLKTVYIGSGKLLLHLDLHFKNNLSTGEIEHLTTQIKEKIKGSVIEIDDVQIELSSQG